MLSSLNIYHQLTGAPEAKRDSEGEEIIVMECLYRKTFLYALSHQSIMSWSDMINRKAEMEEERKEIAAGRLNCLTIC